MSSRIDIDALSGILGSISIACWVVVFTPQIVENFRRSSADGLSQLFIIIWLLGDVFNILGAILQKVLPTMIILAIYYTFADVVLLGQCVWYQRRADAKRAKGKGRESVQVTRDEEEGTRGRLRGRGEHAVAEEDDGEHVATEQSPLLPAAHRSTGKSTTTQNRPHISDADRPPRHSFSSSISSIRSSRSTHAGVYQSPHRPTNNKTTINVSNVNASTSTDTVDETETSKSRSGLPAVVFNTSALLLVCGIGALGWWLSARVNHVRGEASGRNSHLSPILSPLLRSRPLSALISPSRSSDSSPKSVSSSLSSLSTSSSSGIYIDPLGQTFGYLCAVLYLGSRIPQLLLNFRRKSTEGVSLLFFLFACVGNLTYVLSILAYEPDCARAEDFSSSSILSHINTIHEKILDGCRPGEWRAEYGRYILLNTSWLIGSGGTLLLDLIIFVQFYMYRDCPAKRNTTAAATEAATAPLFVTPDSHDIRRTDDERGV